MTDSKTWRQMAAEMLADLAAGKQEIKREGVDGDTAVTLRRRGAERELSMVRWCRQATPAQRAVARDVFGIPDGVEPKITYSRGWGKVSYTWEAA
ncbi:MAG: hypothetical protein FOGNACKC_00886 [Anaerolineae bacterium]|nr:hypothetical protein [Anaerolineae bacterium]